MMEAAEKAVELDPDDGKTHHGSRRSLRLSRESRSKLSPSSTGLKLFHPPMQTCSS